MHGFCLWHLLLRHMASMSEPPQLRENRCYPRRGISSFFSFDRLGPNLGCCASLLHLGIFFVAGPARVSGWPGPRLSDFQTAVGSSCGHRICIDRRFENRIYCGSLGSSSTLRRYSLFRNRTIPSLDSHAVVCARCVAAARAQALSNPLLANVL